MADRTEFELINDGDYLGSGYYNTIFQQSSFQQIYIGSDFNLSTDTSTNWESDVIVTGSLYGMNYIVIEINAQMKASIGDGDAASISLGIQTKEVGGAYSYSFPSTTLLSLSGEGSDDTARDTLSHFKWVHTLSSGEKAAGVQIKLLFSGAGTGSHGVSVINRQTTLKVNI